MRLLLVSDSPLAPSGYGVQAGLLARAWQALGHEVAILAAFGHHGQLSEWQGFPLYPGGLDGYGNDVIGPTARTWRADLVITLKDLWVYRPQEWGVGVRWVPLVPVDHDPIPQGVVQLVRQFAYAPIAYSQFGAAQLHDAGFYPHYAPHTYDPAVLSPGDRAAARQALGIDPQAFCVGMVAVNRGGIPSRKAWPQNLEGFAMFARQHPEARLLCHTHIGAQGREQAVNLAALAEQLGIADRVAFCDQEQYDRGFAPEYLAQFYRAIDVLNAVSIGEGFGIPTLEAQAVGTPVLVGDWTASAELLFAGAAVLKDDAHRFYDGQGAYVFLPEPRAIAAGLAGLRARLSDAGEAARLRERALAGASLYQNDRVRDTHWKPALDALAARLTGEVSRGVLRVIRPESLNLCPASDSWAAEVAA